MPAALGKRTRAAGAASGLSTPSKTFRCTDTSPQPNPKRPRTSPPPADEDPNANKENIPPFVPLTLNAPSISVHDTDIDTMRVTRSRARASDASSTSAPHALTPNTRGRPRRTVSTPLPRPTRPMPQRAASLVFTPPLTPSSEQSSDSPLLTPSLDLTRIQLGDVTSPPSADPTPSIFTPPSTPALSAYAVARAALKASQPGAPLTGRAPERAAVHSFLSSFLSRSPSISSAEKALYVSGTPGTGKTALIRSVLEELTGPKIKVGMVNCMGLGTAKEVYEACWRALAGDVKVKDAKEALEALFADGVKLGVNYILALDEIDTLLHTPFLVTSILQLPQTYPSLRLLTIANTLSLPSLLPSTHAPAQLAFAPYTWEEMTAIVRSKLAASTTSVLDDKALELAARRVGGRTGDLRVLIEVVRKALEAAEKDWRKRTAENPFVPCEPVKVSPAHIMQAVKIVSIAAPATATAGPSTASSPTTALIRTLPMHSRLALLSIVVSSYRASLSLHPLSSSASKSKVTSASDPTPSTLYTTYTALLTRYGTAGGLPQPLGSAEFHDVLNLLDASSLVALSAPSTRKKAQAEKQVRLVVPAEDVRRGLALEQEQPAAGIGGEEGIRRVWERACKDARMEAVRKGQAQHAVEECPAEDRL